MLPQLAVATALSTDYKLGSLSSSEKLLAENYKNLKTEFDANSFEACYKRASKQKLDVMKWVGLQCLVKSSLLTEALLDKSYADLSVSLKEKVEPVYVSGLWALFQKKNLSKSAIKKFEDGQFLQLPKKERARYYNSLASNAVADRELEKAKLYYEKSLADYNDRKLRKKLISDGLIDKIKVDSEAESSKRIIEKKIKSKKIKEALSLFAEHSVEHKNAKGFKSLQRKVSKGIYRYIAKNKITGLEKELSLNSPEDLSVWSYRMMKSHKCLEALYLAELGIKRSQEAISAQNYDAAFYSSINCMDYEKAYYWSQFRQKNTDKFAPDYKEALLKRGFVALRNEKWSEAINLYDELLEVSESSKYRLPALYWSWRAAQKSKLKNKSESLVTQLIKEYPLTYYGLRAAIETSSSKKVNIFKADQLKEKIKITKQEDEYLRHIILASQAGWVKESLFLFKSFKDFKTAEEKLIESRIWSVMENPIQAIRASTQAWDMNPSLTYKQSVKNVYPKKYSETINKYSEAHKMNPYWVLSLIRQESAFQEKAKSSAGALGLMQLMPPTAREMGKRLGVKLRLPSSAWDPYINIRLGSKYLKQMLISMDGHLPLALASYNAGIGNIRKWKAQREDVNKITEALSSDPLEELWIEELHWSETRFYVKAILRNYIIYSLLYEKKPNFTGLLWN